MAGRCGVVRKKPEATKTLFLRSEKLIGGGKTSVVVEHTVDSGERNIDVGLELIGSFGKAIRAWTGCGG